MKTFFSLATLAFLLTACDRPPAPPPASSAARPPLKVAAYYWPGEYWVDIAKDKGWFKEAGLDVQVVDTNPDYFASFKDLVEGRLDVNVLSLFDVLLLNSKGADLAGIATTDQSAGADGIAVRPGIDSIAALKGRRVGVGRGTYGEYLLSVVLTRDGLSLGDVTLVDLPGEKAADELARGAVDACVTWEPVLAEAAAKVKGRTIWDTANLPGVCPFVLTTRRSVVRERGDDLQKLMQVWQRTTDFLQQQPEEAFAIVARVNKKTPAEARDLATKDKVLGLRENLAAFSYAAGFDSLHGTARVMNDFMLKQKLATNRLDSAEFLDPRFLKALTKAEAPR